MTDIVSRRRFIIHFVLLLLGIFLHVLQVHFVLHDLQRPDDRWETLGGLHQDQPEPAFVNVHRNRSGHTVVHEQVGYLQQVGAHLALALLIKGVSVGPAPRFEHGMEVNRVRYPQPVLDPPFGGVTANTAGRFERGCPPIRCSENQ